MDGLLEVGQVVNSYGIKGYLKIVPLLDRKEQFEDFKTLYIEEKNATTEVIIQDVKYSKNLVLLKVLGVETIEEALKFKNKYLLAKRSDIKLEEGAHFIVDLIGLEVFTIEGELLGTIKEVLQPGANDVYVVKNNQREILLPAIPDVVKQVDIDNKKMVIKLLDGLLS